jgi:oxalate decarboxylase/phosphoglucose isomerase-like protein (cupin superfamily)
VITVTKGIVFVGFVDTAGELFAARLRRGDFFLFPVGLVHFQLNAGRGPAETISVLNAQNPGVQFIANSLFGSAPSIDNKVLAKAFGISPATVAAIQKGFAA